MTTFIINVTFLLIIAFIIYWFWFAKNKSNSVKTASLVEIKVTDGIYQPAHINSKVGQPLTLRFIRTDATPCAEQVIFSKLDIARFLPLNTFVDIVIPTNQPGEYEFTCQMGMYRGMLTIK